MFTLTRESVSHAFLVSRQRVTVVETRFAGVRLLRESHINSSNRCLVLDLLQQQVRWHKAKRLVGLLAQVDALLPTIVLANDDATDAVLHAQVHDELADMVEVVLQAEIPLPQSALARTFVVPLVYTLDDATIDQYWTVLVVSYRSQTV